MPSFPDGVPGDGSPRDKGALAGGTVRRLPSALQGCTTPEHKFLGLSTAPWDSGTLQGGLNSQARSSVASHTLSR